MDDLWKFRIPPEFPDVSPPLIRSKIAAAVIGYWAAQGQIVSARDGYEYHRANDIGWWVKQLADTNLDPIDVPNNVIVVSLRFGRESNPYPSFSSKGLIQASYNRTIAGIGTHPALYEAIRNSRIGDLKGVPVLVDYWGFPTEGRTGFRHRPSTFSRPEVVFGRDEAGRIFIEGDLERLYHVHGPSSHPEDLPLPHGEKWSDFDVEDAKTEEDALEAHYKEYAEQRARELFRDFIDPLVLGGPSPRDIVRGIRRTIDR